MFILEFLFKSNGMNSMSIGMHGSFIHILVSYETLWWMIKGHFALAVRHSMLEGIQTSETSSSTLSVHIDTNTVHRVILAIPM